MPLKELLFKTHVKRKDILAAITMCVRFVVLWRGRRPTYIRPLLQKGTQSLNEQSCEIHRGVFLSTMMWAA